MVSPLLNNLPGSCDPLEIRLHFLPLGARENRGVARSSPREQRSSALHLDLRTTNGKMRRYQMVSPLFGDPLEIRTPDPLLKRQKQGVVGFEKF